MTDITVYTKQTCPFCVAAKEKLEKWGYAYTEIDLANNNDAMQFLKDAGHKTVPQIYINNTVCVPDGCSGLTVLGKDGLAKLIADAEATE